MARLNGVSHAFAAYDETSDSNVFFFVLRAGGLSDAEISILVRAAVLGKRAALGGHGDMYGIASAKNRPMTTIGG